MPKAMNLRPTVLYLVTCCRQWYQFGRALLCPWCGAAVPPIRSRSVA